MEADLATGFVLFVLATLLAIPREAHETAPVPTAESDPSVHEARASVIEAEKLYGPQSLEVAERLSELSVVLLKRHEFQDTLTEGTACARRHLAILESHYPDVDDERTVAAVEGLAAWLWSGRDLDHLRPLAERALRIRQGQQPPDENALAADLSLMADLSMAEGDYGRALELREQAGLHWERAAGPDSAVVAHNLYRHAMLLDAIGDQAGALAKVSRAVAIREREGSAAVLPLAVHLNLLGRLCTKTGDWDRAEQALERARGIWEVSGNPNQTHTALALRNLAHLDAARGKYDRAVQRYRRVAEIRSAASGTNDPGWVTLAELGTLERQAGDRAAARVSLRRALALQTRTKTGPDPFWARTLREQARVERGDGNLEAALTAALDAERVSREHFRGSILGLSEREALLQTRERVNGLGLAWGAAAMLASRGALQDAAASRLVDAAIQSRALVLDTLAARRRTLALHPDEDTMARVEALRRAQVRLTELQDNSSDRVSEARADVDRAERALAEKSRQYSDELERGQVGLAAVQDALPEDSALVSYFRYADEEGSGYAASILLPGDAAPRIVQLGGAQGIDAAVQAWSDDVSSDPRPRGIAASQTYSKIARHLAERIWDPLAPHLTGVERVLVVPDDGLHGVSLATLVTARGEYLADSRLSFHYLTAERDLVPGGEDFPAALGLLALGDPTAGSRFGRLPGSRREANEVAARWPGDGPKTVLLGDEATESAFKELAPYFGVLHVAAHAFLRSARAPEESPLRVAGLALAEDPESGEDGILTAEEIALLDLRGVRWAVLSACATGQGALQPGEGVLGLRRSFQIAGARTLIVSLWPVEDDATRHWMRALYDARREGAGTMDAVRSAMGGVLSEQRHAGSTTHPYFWGGFVSVGDWR